MDAYALLNATIAYASVRDAILRGHLAAGERLVAQRLAEQAGLSRTPIKEALARLESEGLVVRAENWGYVVRTISMRDAEEIFEARLVIEVAAAGIAAQRATAAEVDVMTKLLASSQKRLQARNLVDFQHEARAIHETIAQATGNSQLVRMFKQVNDLVLLFGVSLLKANPARATDILSENAAIVAAIRAGNADDAAALMRKHIECGHASFRDTVTSVRTAIRMP
ncbi:MAG: GntR family transcriptional regulator [Burkholderiaceae bacterium]|nr:GntR family transcriptional regulator [Burkholderiaceae bacterium]